MEGLTDQRCMAGKAGTKDHDLATGHLLELECTRVLHEPQDGLGNFLVRIYHQVVIRSVEQSVYLCASQAPGLHPDHRLGHPGSASQQGDQDVGLVASGNGYQEVSVINSRSLEDVHVGSAARDGQEIRLLPNLKKALRGLLNEGHLMALPVQTFSNVGAGLAGTHHDDAHSTNPSLWTSGAGGMPLLRRTPPAAPRSPLGANQADLGHH